MDRSLALLLLVVVALVAVGIFLSLRPRGGGSKENPKGVVNIAPTFTASKTAVNVEDSDACRKLCATDDEAAVYNSQEKFCACRAGFA